MADTTLTIDDETKERLDNYRHPDHENWADVLDSFMQILPSYEDLDDGCMNCGEERFVDTQIEDHDGTVQWFHTEFDGNDVYGSNYYCSPECAHEQQEEANSYVPENPDLVVIGGKDEMRTEFKGATFYLYRDTMEVGIPIPGAFGGSDSHGNEYAYEGEPVYIKNEGQWVQKGVIDNIIHEETHTALILEHEFNVTEEYHPDSEAEAEAAE